MKRTALTLCMAMVVLACFAVSAHANTVSGTVQYEDRTYDRNGINGTQMLPVRFATVTVDIGNPVTETVVGSTDANGNYNINVTNNGSQQVRVLVSAESPVAEPNGPLRVVDTGNNIYAASITQTLDTDTALDVDLDILVASGDAANAMNIFDVCNFGHAYVNMAHGAFITDLLTVRWEDGLSSGTFYDTNLFRITLLGTVNDDDSWDDDIILHEYGHYIGNTISADDSPGGSHSVSQNNQDVRLAWSEGIAHYFGGVIRQFRNDPNSSDPADQVDNFNTTNTFFNLEDFSSSSGSQQNASTEIDAELSVAVTTWDIQDTPGGDDDVFNAAVDVIGPNLGAGANGLNDFEDFLWHVMTVRLPADMLTAPVQITLENNFLLWFFNEGSYNNTANNLQTLFQARGMDYKEDAAEPDNDINNAPTVATDGTTYSRTFFSDNGTATNDLVDIACFNAAAGAVFDIQTFNLSNNCDTRIYVTTDGTTGTTLQENRDISSNSNVASMLEWENDQGTGTYYLRIEREQSTSSSRNQARSRLGAYDFSITQTGGPTNPTAKLKVDDDRGSAVHSVVFTGTGTPTTAATVITRYEYDFDGNGVWDYSSADGGDVSHRYLYAGTFNARLRVTDSNSLSAIDTEVIEVLAPDTPLTLSIVTTASNPFEQGTDTADFDVTVGMLPTDSSVEYFAFDFDDDGRIDAVEFTTNLNHSAQFMYPCIADSNLGGSQTFQARIFVSVFDKNGRETVLSALADSMSVDANGNAPNITSFTVDSDSGDIPLAIQLDAQGTFAGGSTVAFQFDVTGMGRQLTAPMNAPGGVLAYNTTLQVPGLYTPRVYFWDQTLNLCTYSDLTGTSTNISVSNNDFMDITFEFIAPLPSTETGGLTGLAVQVFSGLAELPSVKNMMFQYRPNGGGAFTNIVGTVQRHGNHLSSVFDTSALTPGDFDFGLLIDGDTVLRDAHLVTGVGIRNEIVNAADLDMFDVAGDRLGFVDTDGHSQQFIEVPDTTAGNLVEDGQGNQVLLPFGFAVNPDVTVEIHQMKEVFPLGGNKPIPKGLKHAHAIVDVNIFDGEIHEEGAAVTLLKPIRIRIAYGDVNNNNKVDGRNMKDRTLEAFYYDPIEDQWKEISSSRVSINDNYVEIETTHLTAFGLFGKNLLPALPFGGGGANPCFIATAAYGTGFEPQVDCLREFRDDYLHQSKLGDQTVELYYQTSPPVADTIRSSPILKAMMRRWLQPLAEKFDKTGRLQETETDSTEAEPASNENK